MKTELTYLLEELEKVDQNIILKVKDLRQLIEKSFKRAAKDEETLSQEQETNNNNW